MKKIMLLFLLFISLPLISQAQQRNLDDKLAFDGAIRSHQKIIIGNLLFIVGTLVLLWSIKRWIERRK